MRYQFICEDEMNAEEYWNNFKAKLNDGDEIIFPGFDAFVFGLLDLENKLEFCREHNIRLFDAQWDGLELNPARELDNMYFILSLKNESHRDKQLKGIKEALRLKHEGKGAYGRPLAVLPKNFEQKIVQLKREHKPLEAYRKATGMKKSTFYKYAKIILEKEKEREKAEKAARIKAAAEASRLQGNGE